MTCRSLVLLVLLFIGNVIGAAAYVTPDSHARLWLMRGAEEALALGDSCFNADRRGTYNLSCAERAYQRALELDPQTLSAWHQLARIDFLRGDFGPALVKINQQIELHGDAIPGAFYVRGLIHGFRQEFAEAEQDFLAYQTRQPTSWGVYNDISWVRFQRGDYKGAAKAAREGLAISSQNAWLLNSLGIALLNTGDVAGAARALTEAYARANALTPAEWSTANPGNDPRIAEEGLLAMRTTIEQNLALVDKKLEEAESGI